MSAPVGNKFALGANSGRPPHFENLTDLEKRIQEYFDSCEIRKEKDPETDEEIIIDGKQPTITGLAHFLGFESRQSLYDYEGKEEFTYSIKRAKLVIESNYEQALFGRNAAGPIFALKNFGWKDTQEIKHDLPRGFLNIDPLADDTAHNSAKENSQT